MMGDVPKLRGPQIAIKMGLMPGGHSTTLQLLPAGHPIPNPEKVSFIALWPASDLICIL
jgi:hypothetical protein